MKKLIFEKLDPTTLRWGKPCKHGHCGPNGKSVRTKRYGMCMACKCELPPGPYTFDHGPLVSDIGTKEQYNDIELHKKRVKEWREQNKEKYKEIQNRYRDKEDVKEKYRIKAKLKYEANKEEAKRKQREYYAKRKEARTARYTNYEVIRIGGNNETI